MRKAGRIADHLLLRELEEEEIQKLSVNLSPFSENRPHCL